MSAPTRRFPWRSLIVLGVAVAVSVGAAVWVVSLGGVEAFRTRYGAAAPLFTFPLHVVLTLTPVGEFVPFAAANGAVYGLWGGALLSWGAWVLGAALQRAFGAQAAYETGGVEALPTWVRRYPLGHPVTLTVARWVPGVGALVDAVAGAQGVPFGLHLVCAAVGHAPQAVFFAAVGAGLIQAFGSP